MKNYDKGATYEEALKNLDVPIFVSTEQAIEWGSHLNSAQRATLARAQLALSDRARAECNPQRKIALATQSQLMREAAE